MRTRIPYLRLTLSLVLFSTSLRLPAQSPLDSLAHIREMPYICEQLLFGPEGLKAIPESPCADPLYWRAVQAGKTQIPALIHKLSDTTLTAAPVPNFGGQYAVGDIAWTVLREIIHDLPVWQLLGVEFDRWNCGYCTYWNHLRAAQKHRHAFRKAVRRWYRKHRRQLYWVQSEYFATCDGCTHHPNGGHYKLRPALENQ